MYPLTLLLLLLPTISAKCFDPSPAFPVPSWQHGAHHSLAPAFSAITSKLKSLAKDFKFNTSSFSIEITSATETLYSHHHTARKRNGTRPGTTHVDSRSQYRIASITKTFTTLGILYQHAGGNLSLDDAVSNYIPELSGPETGDLPWKDITLRILASQLSGLPREMAQSDLINELPSPTEVGLPPATKKGLPVCYQYDDYSPCNKSQLLDHLKTLHPVFAPNQESTYSNLNFELLGLVLENVTGLSYEDYMTSSIFEPLDMPSTTLTTPPDTHAVLPLGQYYWDVEEGVHSPTGGIYSCSYDMSKYLRYVLTHFNALATGVNWFMPASWSTGTYTFYGMPWEIFRSDSILPGSKRPVTFVTKSGGVPDYFSRITLMPEYGLGLTVLIGGDNSLLNEIQEIVTVELIRAAESLIWSDMEETYSGGYDSLNSSLNSSLTLSTSSSTGLKLESFISNSTDVFATLLAQWISAIGLGPEDAWHVQLVPTLLYQNETSQEGEVWRMLVVQERTGEEGVWGGFCLTDVDVASYAGLPVNEVVFWHEAGVVELPAWRVRMGRMGRGVREGEGGEGFVVQPPS